MRPAPEDRSQRLAELVGASPLLMRALRAAREVDAPDWLIGAGAIRDLVWDHLHGLTRPRAAEIDFVFFDPSCADDRELVLRRELAALEPGVRWDVTNQATVHLWYPTVYGHPVEPLRSSLDGVATWPETATAVAVRMAANDRVEVLAPLGLEDLFGLICRHNPRRATREVYRARVRNKRFAERWPALRVLDSTNSGSPAHQPLCKLRLSRSPLGPVTASVP